jgi:tetratricopeptide (TPR) repeat protein
MKNNSTQLLILLTVVAIGFGLIFLLSDYLEKNRPALPEGFEDQDLALQGAKLKNYSLGFNGLMADWYWMQSLQYIGNKINKSEGTINIENLRPLKPRLLYPLLDNATSLDPQFLVAYSYGAVVLPAIDPEQAIKITEKGIENNPGEWRLFQHLGYIYWRLKNFEKASETYQKGSEIKGAPTFMKAMVAQMKSQGGSRETARIIYQQMLTDSQDEKTKEMATIRLMQLDSLDEREAVQKVLDSFKTQNNRCASKWSEIFPLLRTIKLPNNKDFRIDKSNNLIDPSNAPYQLDINKCQILLDSSTKIPIQ